MSKNNEYRVVLASNSPRRRQLLDQIDIEYEVWGSNVDESIQSKVPEEVCVELAKQKALDVASQIKEYNESHKELTSPSNILVIGADTIVSVGGQILGKPEDEEDARRMLGILSDNEHIVYTGVSLVFMTTDNRVGEYSFFEATKVCFYPIDNEDMDKYILSGEPLDKAGAYGIQGKAAKFVKGISGDYYNVVGFPVARIINELKKLGVKIKG